MEEPCLAGTIDTTPREFYRSSPLMRVEPFEDLRELYNQVPDAMIDILNEILQATRIHVSISEPTSFENEPQYAEALSLRSHGSASSGGNQQSSPSSTVSFPVILLQVTRLAATIHLRAIRDGILFEDPTNHDDAKHLGALLHGTPLSTWRGIPYIFLWVYVV